MNMDTIANLLTIIRNGFLGRKLTVFAPYSKMSAKVLEILVKEEYLSNVKLITQGKIKRFEVKLKYEGKLPAITGIVKISKPGRRIYRGAKKFPQTPTGFGITIISTAEGLMTGRQAVKKKLGGEVICQVW